MVKYQRQKHCVFNLCFHLIFCTKYRKSYFLSFENQLRKCFLNSSIKYNFIIKEIDIMPDHIHLFIRCKVNHYPISIIVKHLKGFSSYSIRKSNKYIKKYKAFYSPSYFVESIGNISETSIKKYIRNQKINLKPTYKYKTVVEKYNRQKQGHAINKLRHNNICYIFDEPANVMVNNINNINNKNNKHLL